MLSLKLNLLGIRINFEFPIDSVEIPMNSWCHHPIGVIEPCVGWRKSLRPKVIEIKMNVYVGPQCLASEVKLEFAPPLTDPAVILGFHLLQVFPRRARLLSEITCGQDMANISLILRHIEIVLRLLRCLLLVLLQDSFGSLHPCKKHRVVPISILFLYLAKQ